jgi:hypothetical protein
MSAKRPAEDRHPPVAATRNRVFREYSLAGCGMLVAGGMQLFGFCVWLYNSGSHITHGEPS